MKRRFNYTGRKSIPGGMVTAAVLPPGPDGVRSFDMRLGDLAGRRGRDLVDLLRCSDVEVRHGRRLDPRLAALRAERRVTHGVDGDLVAGIGQQHRRRRRDFWETRYIR